MWEGSMPFWHIPKFLNWYWGKKTLLIHGFPIECKPKAHCFIFKKKCEKFKMRLEWTKKVELKMESICMNQNRTWIMQIGIKMVHKWHYDKHIHMNQHGLDLEGIIIFSLKIYYIDGGEDYIKMINY
jgi:hypothetical protein